MSNSNPFSDPSHYVEPLDGNPFNDVSDPHPYGAPAAGASVISLESTGPSKYSASTYGAGGSTTAFASGGGDTFAAREEELKRKDEEIRRRQEDLDRRERELDRTVAKPNWPPFFPLIRHQISDLPETNQTTMKGLYVFWLALILTLVINLVSCILLLIAGSSDGGKDTAASGSYVGIIAVTSFFLWYRPIYLGYAKEQGLALFFYLFFFFCGWHLLFSLYMFIGIPSTGSAGLINTIAMFSQGHILAGVFGAISCAGWGFQTFGGALLYKRVWDFKNGHDGITLANATDQFKRESFKTVVLHQSRM